MVYLDNGATTWPKPEGLWEEVSRVGKELGANPGRAGHRMALEANRVIMKARERVGRLFHISNPLQIVFTLNATEGLNLALLGSLQPGDHVLTSSLEHNGIARPLRYLQDKGIEVTIVQGDEHGVLDVEELKKAKKSNTRMLAVNHGSNVTGVLQPIEDLGKWAKYEGLLFLVDSAQTAGVFPIDTEKMGIDLLAFSGHKGLLGPQGTGGLYIRDGLSLEPLKFGGTGSNSELELQPEILPDRFESGTPNLPGIAGLAYGVEYVLHEGLDKIREHEEKLTQALVEGLSVMEGITLYGPAPGVRRTAVVSFNIEGVDSAEVGFVLDQAYQIACRTGLHCAPMAHRRIGTLEKGGTVRLSPGYFNTLDEIKETLEAIENIRDELV